MPTTTAWQLPTLAPRLHGGAGALGGLPFDFSTNCNAAGPLPTIWQAVQQADRRAYPDPGYHALRAQLGTWHGVPASRVVVVASASAFAQAFTDAARAWRGVRQVQAPLPGYGDYAAAARRAGLGLLAPQAALHAGSLGWWAEPASPGGAAGGPALDTALADATRAGALLVLDLAYQPPAALAALAGLLHDEVWA